MLPEPIALVLQLPTLFYQQLTHLTFQLQFHTRPKTELFPTHTLLLHLDTRLFHTTQLRPKTEEKLPMLLPQPAEEDQLHTLFHHQPNKPQAEQSPTFLNHSHQDQEPNKLLNQLQLTHQVPPLPMKLLLPHQEESHTLPNQLQPPQVEATLLMKPSPPQEERLNNSTIPQSLPQTEELLPELLEPEPMEDNSPQLLPHYPHQLFHKLLLFHQHQLTLMLKEILTLMNMSPTLQDKLRPLPTKLFQPKTEH